VVPHSDVASGKYQQAEFAADLWQVHLGQGSDEYLKPAEFFRRTYLTESLKKLLVNAVERLAGKGGDPVVQLQTNFGGGKTHSMLALYHLFGGKSPSELPGVDSVMAASGVNTLPKAKRVVLVGNRLSPGNPVKKDDGTVVRTLWGELAYQLGGKKAYARIARDDERSTSPGDVLRELLVEYGPSLILIDEWVAYARQLHDDADLPGGRFDTMFTFAQALTESAKLAKNCLLVISLPASDTPGSPHAQADDVEVGGLRGRTALDRLRNVVGRLESSWRPATAEEGFEIVRRRLFEPIAGESFKHRDVTARAFSELYQEHTSDFPPECRSGDYEKRIKDAYPIHPEIFDRLYEDWSTLIKFQRTRGVLRLMATVIHSLWESNDRNPLILPSTIPIDDPRVQSELTRYLSDNWAPIIEREVDGPASLPVKIDREQSGTLGRLQATRRVARTVYLGSAPTVGGAHQGLEDRRVNLGCVMPEEAPSVFGDALRRMAGAATYLYQDGRRYWYATQPTVTKLAEDRAEQLKREPDKVAEELEKRLRADLRRDGGFAGIHVVPKSPADVPDSLDTRLVVLASDDSHQRDGESAALTIAEKLLKARGSAPRMYQNTLVFLAADRVRLQDLDEALRRYLAWEEIVAKADSLELTPHQRKQAEQQKETANTAAGARIPETYQWLLAPEQKEPSSPVTWQALRLVGDDRLADRAAKRLRREELMVGNLGVNILQDLLGKWLWRGNHVEIRQLADDFAKYLYLQRLDGPHVLVETCREGVKLLTWPSDSFAFADAYDEASGRYRGLRAGQVVNISPESSGLLVRPDVARRQLDAEVPTSTAGAATTSGGGAGATTERPESGAPQAPPLSRRFHGSVVLDPTRAGRDAARVADEVISHLAGLVGSDVQVTLEISAEVPNGVPENVVRIVTENAKALKFDSHGFERE